MQRRRWGRFTWTVLMGREMADDRAPSGHASLAHQGCPVVTGEQRGGVDARKSMPAALRFLLRLAVAIGAVIACAGIATPQRGSARLVATTFHVVAAASSSADRGVPPSGALHRWHEGAAYSECDLEAIESDDDKHDPLRDVLAVAGQPFRCGPTLCEPDRDPGGALSVDTSRFAAGTGLPRGPPA